MKLAPSLMLLATGFLAGLAVSGWVSSARHPAAVLPTQLDSAPPLSSTLPSAKTEGKPESATSEDAGANPSAPLQPVAFEELVARFANLDLANPSSPDDWEQFNTRLKASDLAALAREIIEKYPAPGTEVAVFMVFSELAQRSPEIAWQLATDIKNTQLREQAASAVMTVIAGGSTSKAFALIDALPDSSFKTQMRISALSNLVWHDPAAAFELEVKYAGDKPDFAPQMMMFEWVKRDADAAMKAVSRLTGAAAATANAALLQVLAGYDPQKAWNYAQSLPRHKGDIWQDPRYSTLSAWANADPLAAMNTALTLEDDELKSAAIGEIARNWAEADFPAALAFVNALGDPASRAKALAAMAYSSRAQKPELFSALLEFGPVGDQSQTHYLIREWAKEDPTAAAEAVQQLPPGPALEQAVCEFTRGWLSAESTRSEDVIAWTSSLPTAAARAAAARTVFDELGRKDGSAAARLIATLDPALRNEAAWGLAQGWASSEPALAAAWGAALAPESRSAVLPGIVSQWASRTPEQAAAFAQAQDSQGDLVSAVAQQWMPYSPDQAGRWVDKLPAGDARDAGLSSIGQIVANEDPAAAVLWISRMTSAPRREQELQYICSQWTQIDPIAAKAWIGGSNLSADTKSLLLR